MIRNLPSGLQATPGRDVVCAGLDDGRVWAAELRSGRMEKLRADKGPPITALAVSDDGARVAYGDEEGGAGVMETGL